MFFHGSTVVEDFGLLCSVPVQLLVRHTAIGKIPLDECSARRRYLYLKTHNTHKRQIFTPPAGLEPAFPARDQHDTHALDRATTEIGHD
jgi:hypothetical protein